MLRELMADRPPTATLVIDPGECFQCLGIIAEWLEWRRTQSGKFLLLLSRRPDETERRILLVAGIPVDGTIVRGPRADQTPMELVFAGGRVIYQDTAIRRPSSPLLEKLGEMTLGRFAMSIGVEASTSPRMLAPQP